MGNLVCQNTCFSGTGAGYHHAVALRIEDSLTLVLIKFLKVVNHINGIFYLNLFVTRIYKKQRRNITISVTETEAKTEMLSPIRKLMANAHWRQKDQSAPHERSD
jgi:hypothetical protein